MTVEDLHHVSFTVTDLERTVDFYQRIIGMRLCGRKHRRADDLGQALLGPLPAGGGGADAAARPAATGPRGGEILIADMELGGRRVEFIQYLDPATKPYPGDPSVVGSGHLALLTADIDAEVQRLQEAGVRFHSSVRTVRDPGRPVWRWCYFRDPDGIVVELVQSGDPPGNGGPAAQGLPPAG